MGGRNLFETQKTFRFSTTKQEICVFLSYRRVDREEAREVADTILRANIDIYFDEDDKCLSGADENSDPETVSDCIDAGLSRSTHLLGLITPKTQGSWWVPYEIGATRARS